MALTICYLFINTIIVIWHALFKESLSFIFSQHDSISHSVFIQTQNKLDYKINECSWSHSDDSTKYKHHSYKPGSRGLDQYISGLRLLLQESNLIFILKSGTLLGAYRNGGAIPTDFDLDLEIPIWMNLNVLNHSNITYENCPVAKEMFLKTLKLQSTNRRLSHSFKIEESIKHWSENYNIKLCGLSFLEWHIVVTQYFNKTFKYPSFIYSEERSKVHGFKWKPYENDIEMYSLYKFWHRGMRHDLQVAITYNKWLPKNSKLCLCRFNTIMTWCYEDAAKQLENEYGSDFMTPNRDT